MLRHVGEIAERVDEVLHIPLCLRQNLAGVEGFNLADDRLVLLDGVSEAMQQGAAFVRRHLRPGRLCEGMRRGPHGPVDILGREHGKFSQHPPAARIDRLHRFASRSGHILPPHHTFQWRRGEKLFDFRQQGNGGGHRTRLHRGREAEPPEKVCSSRSHRSAGLRIQGFHLGWRSPLNASQKAGGLPSRLTRPADRPTSPRQPSR